MNQSDAINELAAALSKAQGEIQNVVKDAKNPHYKSDYATLDAITDTVRPIFAKHGLAVVQIPAYDGGMVTMETILTHSSGQWLKGFSSAPCEKPTAQGVGSATTYLRRYSLAGIAAIAQTDDDGHAASAAQPSTPPQERSRAAGNSADLLISEAQSKRFYAIALGAGWTDVKAFDWLRARYGYQSSRQIPRREYEAICKAVQNEAKGASINAEESR